MRVAYNHSLTFDMQAAIDRYLTRMEDYRKLTVPLAQELRERMGVEAYNAWIDALPEDADQQQIYIAVKRELAKTQEAQ